MSEIHVKASPEFLVWWERETSKWNIVIQFAKCLDSRMPREVRARPSVSVKERVSVCVCMCACVCTCMHMCTHKAKGMEKEGLAGFHEGCET